MAERSLLGRATPLILARLCTAGITFCIPLVLARAMSLGDYGTYKQLFLLSQTLYYVLPFGVAQSLYYFVPRAPKARPYLGQTLVFLAVMGLLAAALLAAFGDALASALSNPELVQYLPALCVYVACLVGSFPLEISLTSQGRTRQAAVCYLVSDTLRAALMIAPIALGLGMGVMMWSIAGFAALRMAAAWVVALRAAEGPLWSGRLFVNQLLYAAPFGAAMLLAIPQQYAHQFAVSSSVPPALFAIYAVGCFQLPLVDLLYTPTSEVLMVKLGELERAGLGSQGVLAFREAAAKLAFAFLPMAAFLFAAAPEFLGALFGARYLDATPLFRVSVVAVVLAILPMDGVLRARNQTRYLFFSYAVKAAVTVPLVYFGVKHFGMMGGIGSWAIAELVGKLTLLMRVPAALADAASGQRLTIRQIIPWRELSKAAGAAAAAAAAVIALRSAAPAQVSDLPDAFLWRALPLGVAGVLFLTGYLTVLQLSGVRVAALLTVLRRRTA